MITQQAAVTITAKGLTRSDDLRLMKLTSPASKNLYNKMAQKLDGSGWSDPLRDIFEKVGEHPFPGLICYATETPVEMWPCIDFDWKIPLAWVKPHTEAKPALKYLVSAKPV